MTSSYYWSQSLDEHEDNPEIPTGTGTAVVARSHAFSSASDALPTPVRSTPPPPSTHQPPHLPPKTPQQQQLPLRTPSSTQERLLAGTMLGSGSSTTATDADLTFHLDTDLQALWDVTNAPASHSLPLHYYERSPLNPAVTPSGNPQLLQQEQLHQQLTLLATALLPRTPTTPSLPPITSSGSGGQGSENRSTTHKSLWADCLPRGSWQGKPSLPAPATPLPITTTLREPSSQFLKTSPKAQGTKAEESAATGQGGVEQMVGKQASGGMEQMVGKQAMGGQETSSSGAEKDKDWEPRVRRRKARSSSNLEDDEGAVSDDGVIRIKAKSMSERQRRDRISDGLRRLREVVNSHGDMATMLNEAVELIQQQKRHVDELEMQILQQRLRQQLGMGCPSMF